MSTYWYYECLDHPGGLTAEDEFTQHTDDRHFKRGIQLISMRPVERDDSYWQTGSLLGDAERVDSYFEMQARGFLNVHPNCRLGIINEYGDRRGVPDQTSDAERAEAAIAEIGKAMAEGADPRHVWEQLTAALTGAHT